MKLFTTATFVLALASVVPWTHAMPASSNFSDQLRPYIQVKTVEGEEFRVRAFFSPGCSFSKQYFPFFLNLAKTLPDDKQFAFSPVVNKADGVTYAIAFAAVQRFYPRYMTNFVEASLRGTQELGISTRSWFGIDRISRAAGIPVSLPKLIEANLPALQKDVEQMIALQARLKITNTPSVAVSGTYIVTPEFTGGDSNQFSTLVNAVVSMTTLHQ